MGNIRTAFYGGSFDPIHRGHLAVGETILDQFLLDEFVYIPAFHAPHKVRTKPTSAYDRYAMLCLATASEANQSVSRMEIEAPARPYTVETLSRLTSERNGDDIYFVMGADSWRDIKTWREWEKVLTMTNHIVVTRPGVELLIDHVTDEIRGRIIDLRGNSAKIATGESAEHSIYLIDTVNLDISGSEIRRQYRDNDDGWRLNVTPEVANYIEKYQIYK